MSVKAVMPMLIKGKPYDHQVEGFNYICDLFGLVDGNVKSHGAMVLCEMGLGKGLIAISVTGALLQYGFVSRVLVVCPLSVIGVWENEFPKFADFDTEVTALRNSLSKTRKIQLIREATEKAKDEDAPMQILVVNYESAWILKKELLEFSPDLIIADEGHKIKNPKSKRAAGLHELGDNARYRMLLTGTLITNKEMDAFSQYRFANSNIFGRSFYAFRNRYFEMVGYGFHIPVFRESRREDFLKRMHSIAFRKTKDEALNLPEKTEEVRTVELEPKVMKLYREIEKESYAELGKDEISAVNVLTRMLRLSQITGGFVGDDEKNIHAVSTAKLDAVMDIVDSAMADGQKLVIMCRFVPEMDGIEAELTKRDIAFAHVRGGVKDRAEEVRRFQEDADCSVFIGQIAAAGVGITLTAASTMVFYSLDYDMSNFQQAQDRIHRIGQKNACHYIYLVADKTVDGKVLQSLRDKTNLARMLVDDYRRGLNPFANTK